MTNLNQILNTLGIFLEGIGVLYLFLKFPKDEQDHFDKQSTERVRHEYGAGGVSFEVKYAELRFTVISGIRIAVRVDSGLCLNLLIT